MPIPSTAALEQEVGAIAFIVGVSLSTIIFLGSPPSLANSELQP